MLSKCSSKQNLLVPWKTHSLKVGESLCGGKLQLATSSGKPLSEFMPRGSVEIISGM